MQGRVLKPFKRYNPGVWKPWMEVALIHHLADHSHAEIAQACGKGEQSIKQFVRSAIFQAPLRNSKRSIKRPPNIMSRGSPFV